MWYRMAHSWRGALIGVTVVAGLLLVFSAAFAQGQNNGNGEEKKQADNSQQAQPAQPTAPAQPGNGRGQGPPASTPPGQQVGKGAEPATRGRDLPATAPSSPPAGGSWQRGRSWQRDQGQDRSASAPAGNRPVYGQPVQSGGGADRTSGNRGNPYLRQRPTETNEGAAQETTKDQRRQWSPGNSGQSDRPQASRGSGERPKEPAAAPDWKRSGRPVSSDRPAQASQPSQKPSPKRVTVPEQPSGEQGRNTARDRTQARERAGPAQERVQPSQGQPKPGNAALKQRGAQVPDARFRGAEAEKAINSLPRGEGDRVKLSLRDSLRQMNGKSVKMGTGRPAKDVVGNVVPSNTQLVVRSQSTYVNVNYQNIHLVLGDPVYNYLFLPRYRDDYWDGYWDGFADGYWAGRHYRHHPVVVLNYYYPYYYSDPYWVAFWYGDMYPSVYHYWGWCPGWVYPQRVYYAPVEYVYVPRTPYRYYYTGYSLDYDGAEQAIGDIRRSWFDSDIGTLAYHLTDQQDIRIYFDGEYSYTTTTEDYYAMTADTMATTDTVSLDFDDPIWISTNEVFYTGRHVFYDPEGTRNTVYISYRLRRLGSDWYIVAVGSSIEPIRHQYHDFRYS